MRGDASKGRLVGVTSMTAEEPRSGGDVDRWPELTYRYVKHYFWEPQHLLHTEASIARAKKKGLTRSQAVDALLRSQEVPLNYLLNVFLRIAPATLRRECLAPFGIDLADPGLSSLKLKAPELSLPFIQPDVQLESGLSRVLIELKLDARLNIDQIRKYVRLHSDINLRSGVAKRAYVLFLVKKRPLRIHGPIGNLELVEPSVIGSRLKEALHLHADEMTFGMATWSAFAQGLRANLDHRQGNQTEADEMLGTLVGDLLADLRLRGLSPTV